MARRGRGLCVLWAVLLLVGSVRAQTVHLVLLHINDTHGHLYPDKAPDGKSRGGYARLATKVRQARAENPGRVLFFHTGDIISRGDAVTCWTGGEVNCRILEQLGCDAITPGNGDFYSGVDNLQRLRGLVSIPFLHGNGVPRPEWGKPFSTTLVKAVAGLRIGLFGVGRVNTDHPSYLDLALRDSLDTGRQAAAELRSQVDLLVGLTHHGFEADKRLVAAQPDIDVIIGGDSHTPLNPARHVPRPGGRGEALIAQAGDNSRYMGRVEVDVRQTGEAFAVEKLTGRLEPLDETVPEDTEVKATLDRWQQTMAAPLFRCDADVPHPKTGRSPMGELVAEAVRSAAETPLALVLREEVLAGLKAGAGTLNDVVRVNPYHGRLVVATLTGEQIRATLAAGQTVAAGCTWQGDGATVADVQVAGQRLVADQTYAVATTYFGYHRTAAWRGTPVRETGRRLDEALAAWLKQQQVVRPR